MKSGYRKLDANQPSRLRWSIVTPTVANADKTIISVESALMSGVIPRRADP